MLSTPLDGSCPPEVRQNGGDGQRVQLLLDVVLSDEQGRLGGRSVTLDAAVGAAVLLRLFGMFTLGVVVVPGTSKESRRQVSGSDQRYGYIPDIDSSG